MTQVMTQVPTKLRVGDQVIVTTGADKGKTGKIQALDLVKKTVLVEGVNAKLKHKKPAQTDSTSGIISVNRPIAISNVSYYLEKEKKATRLGYKWLDNTAGNTQENNKKQVGKKTGKKVRFAISTGEVLGS